MGCGQQGEVHGCGQQERDTWVWSTEWEGHMGVVNRRGGAHGLWNLKSHQFFPTVLFALHLILSVFLKEGACLHWCPPTGGPRGGVS